MRTKRDDILAASLIVFQEEGVAGARMERIADVASVSKRTLYKYFDNKTALFEAISQAVLETLSSMDMPAFDPAMEIEIQLLEAVRAYYAQVTEPRFMNCSRVLMAELMRNPDYAREFNEAFEMIDAPLAGFVEGAMQSGHLKMADAKEAASRLLALFKATIYLPLLVHNASAVSLEHMDKVARESVETFLLQFGNPDPKA